MIILKKPSPPDDDGEASTYAILQTSSDHVRIHQCHLFKQHVYGGLCYIHGSHAVMRGVFPYELSACVGLRSVSVCFTLLEKWVVLHCYNPYIRSVVEQWMNRWYSIFRDNDIITWLLSFESGNFCGGKGIHDAGILWCKERVCAKLCGNITWKDAVKRSAAVLSTIYVYKYAYIHTLHYITAIHIHTYVHVYMYTLSEVLTNEPHEWAPRMFNHSTTVWQYVPLRLIMLLSNTNNCQFDITYSQR